MCIRDRFDCDRDELLSSFPENGISGVVTCGTDIITSEKAIALAEKYPFIYAAVGFHALNLDSLTADWCGDIKISTARLIRGIILLLSSPLVI